MRYLPLTDRDRAAMLTRIGAPSINDLFKDVPDAARLKGPVDLPAHKGEIEVERHLSKLAARNLSANDSAFFLGAGAYRHHVPSSVDHLIQRSEFLTSYTPYQPEIAQGTLQYLFEFQTQVALLTGMEVANASLYDGSTAAAEGVLMAARITGRKRIVLSGNLHPQYADVIMTTAETAGLTVVTSESVPGGTDMAAALIDGDTACIVVQNPDFFGGLHNLTPISEAAAAKGALTIAVVAEVVSLGLVTPPGHMGADIVAAEGQSIGNALNFGGPYVGLFAVKSKYVRAMPGRLAGMTKDADGRRGFVLTLSTREQHIRREKATSNICTNSGLCCLAFTIHMALLGEEGFRKLSHMNHERAVATAKRLARVPGVQLLTPNFFNEFTLRLPKPAAGIVDALAAEKIIAGLPVSRLRPDAPWAENLLVVAATELTTDVDIEHFATALTEVLS
ncbi:MAG TPA: aminomethyl-transferring glycine dehydrogenase subunit GcvPA [Alphaproteobacteria bacterium]|nr:aminomethyl-transferring glycine dehydrogenase subunit GcvPA [Alphaproteobacteria bacterium]HAJ48085.1 aminomethyl-transferring glycine dehydrogenase subunit GcvPA [Alphaproteobacteria bacterium]